MARKRGGLAGLYDRNKGWIRAVAPAALSFIPGVGIPLAAAAGAALGGDVEGEKYFNGLTSFKGMTGAIRGGLEGYGIGKGTQGVARGVKSGLGKMFAPEGLPASGAPKVTGTVMRDVAGPMNIGVPRMGAPVNLPLSGAPSVGMTPSAAGTTPMNIGVPRMRAPVGLPMSGAPSVGVTPSAAVATPINIGAPRMAAQDIGSLLKPAGREAGKGFKSRVGDFTKALESRPKTIEAVAKGIQMAMPSPGSEAAMMNAETQRQYLDMQRQQMQEEQRRRETIAALLMPMYQQMMQSRGVMLPNSITARYGG
jgi:hypothetical protein